MRQILSDTYAFCVRHAYVSFVSGGLPYQTSLVGDTGRNESPNGNSCKRLEEVWQLSLVSDNWQKLDVSLYISFGFDLGPSNVLTRYARDEQIDFQNKKGNAIYRYTYIIKVR